MIRSFARVTRQGQRPDARYFAPARVHKLRMDAQRSQRFERGAFQAKYVLFFALSARINFN